MEPITYPARPIDGGRLEHAAPKPGRWLYEPKYNGWRALIHVPSRRMYNRYGERLSIEHEFTTALERLSSLTFELDGAVVEWLDCEALDRRHRIGRGTLLVLDMVPPCRERPRSRTCYRYRRKALGSVLTTHPADRFPAENQVHLAPAVEEDEAMALYEELRGLNRRWRCRFYEGLVAKRAESIYPVQQLSPSYPCPSWMKHRFDR